MNLRWLAVGALIATFAVGCSPARRRHDAYQELLNAEKRYLEDQLYKLDYEIDVLAEKYHSTVRENAALRAALRETADPDVPAPERALRPPPDPNLFPPPEVDLGDPTEPGIEPPPITPPSELRDGELLEGADASASDVQLASHEELADPRVTHIHLNPLLTGGVDLDDHAGDEGVSVVVEPRNAAGNYVPMPGPVSVVVLDPSQQGEAARVARWDFSVEETREALARSTFGRGIHLQLPWPGESPATPDLHVFVRYTAPDGAKMEASREIFIEIPGHISSRWTPLAPSPDAEADELDLSANVAVHPGAAEPRPPLPPPSGPSGPEKQDRPTWRPYR